MGKWYDHLVATGATAEEAKALDSPAAEKAYLALAAERDTFKKNFEDSETNLKAYEDSVQTWYKDSSTKLTQAQNDAIAAAAEAARHKAALEAAQKQGLLDVAKDLNWTPDPPKKEPTSDEKYISREDFGKLMGEAGGTLARMADFKDEFARLFPGQSINVSELLAESKAKGAPNMFDYAEKKYNLPAVRAAAAEKARNDEIAKWKAEGKKEAETELASKMGNPFTRPGMPSQRPIFQARNDDPLRDGKKPWEQVDGKLSEDRVNKAINKFNERQFQN
jgi:hypothetical protein